MATKKTTKKTEKVEKESVKEERYFYGLGKRKTAIAQVRIYPVEKNEKGILINGRKAEEYLHVERLFDFMKAPLTLAGEGTKFDVSAKVKGGGISAQAEAIKLGIARALVAFNSDLKKSLRDGGFLTRDARVVERKKPGLKKARRAPQWAKR